MLQQANEMHWRYELRAYIKDEEELQTARNRIINFNENIVLLWCLQAQALLQIKLKHCLLLSLAPGCGLWTKGIYEFDVSILPRYEVFNAESSYKFLSRSNG